jgi:hypothetical protein
LNSVLNKLETGAEGAGTRRLEEDRTPEEYEGEAGELDAGVGEGGDELVFIRPEDAEERDREA